MKNGAAAPFLFGDTGQAARITALQSLLSSGTLTTRFNASGQQSPVAAGEPKMTEMTQLNRMIQQHILEHQSRLKHVDELLERAQQKTAKAEGDAAEQLAHAKQERDKLSSQVEEFKLRPPDQWSEEEFEKTGPMVIWDTLAQKLEKLVERLER